MPVWQVGWLTGEVLKAAPVVAFGTTQPAAWHEFLILTNQLIDCGDRFQKSFLTDLTAGHVGKGARTQCRRSGSRDSKQASPSIGSPNSKPAMDRVIYKVLSRPQWEAAVASGEFTGSAIDVADGYIHFSAARQVIETVRKHFAGQDDLLLLSVDAEQLGSALKWEPSRGGDLFPHLYGSLPVWAVLSAVPLPLGPDGNHRFPSPLDGHA